MYQAMEDRVGAAGDEDEPESAPEAQATDTVEESEPVTEEDDAQEAAGAEAVSAAEEVEEVEEKADSIMIPKARLDQEAARRRAAENRLKEIQSKMNTGENTAMETKRELEELALDFGDTPKQMFDKILDGDIDTANELFSSILRKAATSAAQAGYNQARGEIGEVVQQRNYQEAEGDVIARLESEYDFFNPGSEAFSTDAVNETLALQQGFLTQGYTPADAMQVAADYYVRVHRPDLLQPQSAPQAEQKAPAPAPASNRTKEVKRNLDANRQQPPSVPTSGGNETVTNDLPDIMTLSEEEIDALPEATIKRLRGDFL